MGGGPPKEKVLITLPGPEPTDLIATLRSQHPTAEISWHTVTADSPLPADTYKTVTVLVTLFSLPPTLSAAPALDLIQLFSAGSNHIATSPFYTSSDVPIATASGIHGPQIAEWVVLAALARSHRLPSLYALQRRHEWGDKSSGPDWTAVQDRVGRRLGVLGYGSIGRQVGRVAHALGMDVLAYTASPKDSPASRRDTGFVVPGTGDVDGTIPSAWYSGLDRASLHAFLGAGLDVLLVSVPLTDATRGLLGRDEFAVLRRAGTRTLVVNIARGAIVRQDELIEALKDGSLDGAALDVTDPEPLPADSELWDLPNVMVTPHVSGSSTVYTERALQLLDQQLTRRANGEKLLNVVQRERGY